MTLAELLFTLHISHLRPDQLKLPFGGHHKQTLALAAFLPQLADDAFLLGVCVQVATLVFNHQDAAII